MKKTKENPLNQDRKQQMSFSEILKRICRVKLSKQKKRTINRKNIKLNKGD